MTVVLKCKRCNGVTRWPTGGQSWKRLSCGKRRGGFWCLGELKLVKKEPSE